MSHPTLAPSPRRTVGLALVVLVLAVGLAGCLGTPGTTDQIALVSTRTVNGWKYDYYRNTAYPCSISGYQTFAIGTKVGSAATDSRPLWVMMHGGGAGWFDETGAPMPTAGQKSEESFDSLLGRDSPGLVAKVKAAPEGFRMLIVSMCSHDIYGGNNTPDPNNPNTAADGTPRPTTGLIATKAAIQYAEAQYPTDDFFLHGTSAGSAGTYNVGWALQQQGIPPTGMISDSGVMNQAWELWVAQHGLPGSAGCAKATEDRGAGVLGRIDPELGDPDNEPHDLVSSGRLTVPELHVWNRADNNSCGDTPMDCPLPNGTSVTMGASECRHAPMRLAIEGQGAGSKSLDMAVCVEGNDTAVACDRHVVTSSANLVNTAPGVPADFQTAIMTWVRARMADD